MNPIQKTRKILPDTVLVLEVWKRLVKKIEKKEAA